MADLKLRPDNIGQGPATETYVQDNKTNTQTVPTITQQITSVFNRAIAFLETTLTSIKKALFGQNQSVVIIDTQELEEALQGVEKIVESTGKNKTQQPKAEFNLGQVLHRISEINQKLARDEWHSPEEKQNLENELKTLEDEVIQFQIRTKITIKQFQPQKR